MSRRFRARDLTVRSGLTSAAFGLGALAVAACGSTVSNLEPTRPDENGVSHKQYRIECIKPDECSRLAARACGTNYSVVSEWNNTIPESNLPGLNEQSNQERIRHWDRYYLPRQTGIESQDPMPLKSIVVACRG